MVVVVVAGAGVVDVVETLVVAGDVVRVAVAVVVVGGVVVTSVVVGTVVVGGVVVLVVVSVSVGVFVTSARMFVPSQDSGAGRVAPGV